MAAGRRAGAVLLLLAAWLQLPPVRPRSLRFATLVREERGAAGADRAGPGRSPPGRGNAVPPAGVPARRSLAHQGLPAGPLPGERLAAGLRAADAGACEGRAGAAGRERRGRR